jgi:hypothetical protein
VQEAAQYLTLYLQYVEDVLYSIGIEAKDAEIVPSEEDQRMPETYFELDANAGNDVYHSNTGEKGQKQLRCCVFS